MRDPSKPAFVITIDTEGDNFWARRPEVTTENARFLPRFQELCERYGLKATYLTDYEMAIDPGYIDFVNAAVDRGYAEVGMHLHAWHSPPFEAPLTSDDYVHHPYLIEFPDEVMIEKITAMTELLSDATGGPITSHRAGRWAFDGRYAAVLADLGYIVDCSVTPFTSWTSHKGDPRRAGGSDYRFAPATPYFMDAGDVTRPGDGPLLQLPMTVMPRFSASQCMCPEAMLANRWGQRAVDRLLPNVWLRPSSKRPGDMMTAARRSLEEGLPYAMFMTHSSELMPGGSPYFPTSQSVEKNYAELEKLFGYVADRFEPMTISEFAGNYIAGQRSFQGGDLDVYADARM